MFPQRTFRAGGVVANVGPLLPFDSAEEAGGRAVAGEALMFEIGVNALVFVHCS